MSAPSVESRTRCASPFSIVPGRAFIFDLVRPRPTDLPLYCLQALLVVITDRSQLVLPRVTFSDPHGGRMHHLSRDAEASNLTTAAGHLVSQQLLSLTSGHSILRRGPDVAHFTDLGERLTRSRRISNPRPVDISSRSFDPCFCRWPTENTTPLI